MPDPSITISPSLQNASVGPNFGTGGSVSPTDAGVTVSFSNGGQGFGGAATVMHGQWRFRFQNVAAGIDYTLKASVDGLDAVFAQDTGITVE